MQVDNKKPMLLGLLVMALIAVVFLVYAFTTPSSPDETTTEEQVIAIIFGLATAYAFLKFRKSYSQTKEKDIPLK